MGQESVGEAQTKPFFEFTLNQTAQRILIPSAKSDLLMMRFNVIV